MTAQPLSGALRTAPHEHVASGSASGRLRVLYVTPRYYPLMGGVENHVDQVTQRLLRAGVDVTVLTADASGKLPSSERINGVQVRRVRAWPAERDYYFAPAIARVIASEPWDLVHVQSYHTLVAPLAMLAALRAGLPYVVTFHGGGHSSRLRSLARAPQIALLRPLLRRAARLVAIARFEIEHYGQQLGVPAERFALIPNGADLPEVPDVAPAAGDGPLIASVGRLERYKGHQRVIAALPALLETQPNARLRVVGAGPYEPTLRRLATELGVASRVEIGPVPPTDRHGMAALLKQAALVTLLSDYETHPIAALEALALGRPVLVADSSGMRELAERGLARAISLDSRPHDVAAAMLEQLRRPSPPARLELPTWDDCASNLLQLYHTLPRRPICAS